MANATEHDARAGYEIYRAVDGNISRDDLNARLQQAKNNTIANRTFMHYRRLLDANHDEYVPINQFDVGRLSG